MQGDGGDGESSLAENRSSRPAQAASRPSTTTTARRRASRSGPSASVETEAPQREATAEATSEVTAKKKLARAEEVWDKMVQLAQWLHARVRRKDAMPEEHRALVVQFWSDSRNTSASPSERDVRRIRTGKDKFGKVQHEYHPTHYQFKKTCDLHSDFKKQYPHIPCSYGMFQSLKPYYVVRGKQSTCECRYCENLRQMLKAARLNRELFECLSIPRQHAARCIQLWCARQRARRGVTDERAQPTIVRLSALPMPRKGPLSVIKGRVSRTRDKLSLKRDQVSVTDLIDADKKSDVLRLLSCPLSVDAWKLEDGRSFSEKTETTNGQRKLRVNDALKCMGCGCSKGGCGTCGGAKRVWRDPAVELDDSNWGPLAQPKKRIKFHSYRVDTDDDGDFKSDNELHEHRLHPSKFLDEFFIALEVYKKHYNTFCRQKHAHEEQQRNFMPWHLLLDMDFAENFTIILGKEIQSAHWISKQVTIFITIGQHLCWKEWQSRDSLLKDGDEITVERTGGRFWARVAVGWRGDADGDVQFVDWYGRSGKEPRANVRKRVIKSVAHLNVSNDKDHDTHFVQNAMQMQWDWYKTQQSEFDVSQITHHIIRSDGAGSHFKSKYTFHSLGDYRKRNGLVAVTWDVGCPGHGKGPWDGIAGFTKRTLRMRIVDDDLVLENEKAVHDEIVKLCSGLNPKARLQTKPGKINLWNIMWTETDDITRPALGSRSVDAVNHRELKVGVRNLFHFAVSSSEGTCTGLMLQQFSCGCNACLNLDSAARVDGCRCSQQRSLCNLNRTDDVGIAAQLRQKKEAALALAARLRIGDVVALETGDHRRAQRDGGGTTHGFLLARVLPIADGAAHKITTDRMMRSHDNQEYRPGDGIFLVRLWYRHDSDESGLTFRAGSRVYTANCSSLIDIVDASHLTDVPPPRRPASSDSDSDDDDLPLTLVQASMRKLAVDEDQRLDTKVGHSASSTAQRRGP